MCFSSWEIFKEKILRKNKCGIKWMKWNKVVETKCVRVQIINCKAYITVWHPCIVLHREDIWKCVASYWRDVRTLTQAMWGAGHPCMRLHKRKCVASYWRDVKRRTLLMWVVRHPLKLHQVMRPSQKAGHGAQSHLHLSRWQTPLSPGTN